MALGILRGCYNHRLCHGVVPPERRPCRTGWAASGSVEKQRSYSVIAAGSVIVLIQSLIARFLSNGISRQRQRIIFKGGAFFSGCLSLFSGAFAEELWIAFCVIRSGKTAGTTVTTSIVVRHWFFGAVHFYVPLWRARVPDKGRCFLSIIISLVRVIDPNVHFPFDRQSGQSLLAAATWAVGNMIGQTPGFPAPSSISSQNGLRCFRVLARPHTRLLEIRKSTCYRSAWIE